MIESVIDELPRGNNMVGMMRVLNPIQFTVLYQGRSSNVIEGNNLTYHIEHGVANGELQDVELFVFTDNLVFKSVI